MFQRKRIKDWSCIWGTLESLSLLSFVNMCDFEHTVPFISVQPLALFFHFNVALLELKWTKLGLCHEPIQKKLISLTNDRRTQLLTSSSRQSRGCARLFPVLITILIMLCGLFYVSITKTWFLIFHYFVFKSFPQLDVVCLDTFFNKRWCLAGTGVFTVRLISRAQVVRMNKWLFFFFCFILGNLIFLLILRLYLSLNQQR